MKWVPLVTQLTATVSCYYLFLNHFYYYYFHSETRTGTSGAVSVPETKWEAVSLQISVVIMRRRSPET